MVLLDGSTDKGNIDNEAMLVVWCDLDGHDEKIHTRLSYFKLARPKHVTAEGLFEMLAHCLQCLGIQEVDVDNCKKLIGIGTDGASANIANAGLKGIMERKIEWIYWMWCLAHRLELALKNALNGTYFDFIDDMLLKLYYLYDRSPKKCRELMDIVEDLKEFLNFDDNGVKPIRANGTGWVTHKLCAMKRVLSKFSVYTHHLAALSVDSTVKSADWAKLKGYYLQWVNSKYILGCALFIDILTPCSIFSKVMQDDEIDILGALTSLLKTLRETETLASKPLSQWSIYAATLKKFTNEGERVVYQSQEVKLYRQAVEYYLSHYEDICQRVSDCIKSRLGWSDLQLMRDIILVLSTQGWEKLVRENHTLEEINRLVTRFKIPLQGSGAVIEEIDKEFGEMIEYAVNFISLSTLDYSSVWWKLFHCPSKCDWVNALTLVELLFSLPASNGKVERVYVLYQ